MTVFINLALAIADTLECPECPKDLRDALNDSVVNELIDLFSPSNPVMLRALASITTSGHSSAYPEPEKAILDHQDATVGRPEKALAASQNWQSC